MLSLTRRCHGDKKQATSKRGKRRCGEDTGIVTPTSSRARKQHKIHSSSPADLKIEEQKNQEYGCPPALPKPSSIYEYLSSPFSNTTVTKDSDSCICVDESLYLPTFGFDDSTNIINDEDGEIRMINYGQKKLKLRPRFGKNPFACNDR